MCSHTLSWGQIPDQLKQAKEYTSVGSDEHVSFFCRVTHQFKQRKVNTTSWICSCETWLRLEIAGRHLIVALNARKKIFELSVLTDQCYHVTTYQTTVGAMLIPMDHSIVNNLGVSPANISVRWEDPRKEALDRGKKKPAAGCVDRTGAGSVVELMDTTVRPSALLRTSIKYSCHSLHITLRI